MEPKFILVERNTVLCGAPDEPGIRDAALLTAKSHGAAVSLYAFVDTCRPSEPVWDSAAASAPVAERFSVGETVEANYSDDEKVEDWRKAVIVTVDNSRIPYEVEFECDAAGTEWRKAHRVRRPVTVPAPAAQRFEPKIGDTVLALFDWDALEPKDWREALLIRSDGSKMPYKVEWPGPDGCAQWMLRSMVRPIIK